MGNLKDNMKLKSFDDLFGGSGSNGAEEIDIDKIDDFANHPYRVVDDEQMQQLVESIKQNGVINEAIVIKKDGGRYEMVSGHRRKRACQLAGISTMPCKVADIDHDTAVIYMVDSNNQRDEILPSEKAYAYKMRLEAVRKKNGQPSGDDLSPLGTNFSSGSRVAAEAGESRNQIYRYIRLTELIKPILDKVDTRKLPFRVAVEISFLSRSEQQMLLPFIDIKIPSIAQAVELKTFAARGMLDEDTMLEILSGAEEKSADNGKREKIISNRRIAMLIPPRYTEESEIVDYISEALEFYQKNGKSGVPQ